LGRLNRDYDTIISSAGQNKTGHGVGIVGTSSAQLPVVGVETPTYNRAHSLPAAIESVRAQTYPHWRLLIADDGSTDNTREVVAPYVREDCRVIYLRMAENRGVLAARNVIYDNLPDDVTWITKVDSDDVLIPEALEIMTGRLADVPEARILKFASRWADGPMACASVTAGCTAGYRSQLLGKDPKGEWVNFIHRSFIDQGMRYDERLRRKPSVGLALHLARIAESHYFPEVVRVMTRDNVSITRPVKKDTNYYKERVQIHRVFFEQFGEDLMSFSKLAYSRKMGRFSRACSGAGLMNDAWSSLRRSIAVYPWTWSHFMTAGIILKNAVMQ